MAIRLTRVGLRGLAFAATTLIAASAAGGQPGVHDGLYLRLGVGFGYLVDFATSEEITVLGVSDEISAALTGVAGLGELAVGGAVSPGLFLGGGVYAHVMPSPEADDVEWRDVQTDVEFDSSSFWLLGPFVDYYLDPRGGLHLQGSVGLAYGVLGDGEAQDGLLQNQTIDDMSGVGLGLLVGVGHEWWVGDAWSLGVLGRFALGTFSSESEAVPADVDWSHLVLAPGVLFTATLN